MRLKLVYIRNDQIWDLKSSKHIDKVMHLLDLTIYISVSNEYLTAVNEFIRVKCSETAVSFIYLPPPPAGPPGSHVSHLEAITRNLPPTILVNGVSPVITTTL